jgi:hypothetical protein
VRKPCCALTQQLTLDTHHPNLHPALPPLLQDAWNDVVASARSIMYSIADPAAVFDVFWFSNDVERIGEQVRSAAAAWVARRHGTAAALGAARAVMHHA